MAAQTPQPSQPQPPVREAPAPPQAAPDDIISQRMHSLIGSDVFTTMTRDERRRAMSGFDPDFSSLDRQSQDAVLGQIETMGNAPTATQALVRDVKENPATAAGLVAGLATAPYSAPVGLAAAGLAGAAAQGGKAYIEGAPAGEVAQQAITGGVTEAAKEGAGRGALAVGGKLLAPFVGGFSRSVTPEAQRATEFLGPYVPRSGSVVGRLFGRRQPLTPAQMTDSPGLDYLDNVASGSIVGGGMLQRWRMQQQPIMLQHALDDILANFADSATPTQIADAFRAVVEGRLHASQLVTNSMYGTLARNNPNLTVDIGAAIAAAQRRMGTAPAMANIASDQAGVTLARRVAGMPQRISLADAQELRSLLLAEDRSIDPLVREGFRRKIATINEFTHLVDDATETALQQGGTPGSYQLWRSANAQLRRTRETLDNDVIRGLLRRADPEYATATGKEGLPEAMLDALFRPKNNTGVRNVLDAVGGINSQEGAMLQRAFIDKLLREASGRGTGDLAAGAMHVGADDLTGRALTERLVGRSGYGEAMLREIIPDAAVRHNLLEFANAMQVVQRANPTNRGRMFVAMGQGGALAAGIGALVGHATGVTSPRQTAAGVAGSAAVFIAPNVLARMLLNPYASRLLTRSIRMAPTARAAATLFTRIATEASRVKEQMETAGVPPLEPGASVGAFVAPQP